MSQENVERLREAYELLNTHFAEFKAGDLGRLLDYFDPDVVIETVDAPDPATYEGHEGVCRWFNDAFGVWAALHVEAEGFIESEQWTVAHLRASLRGEASGVPVELPLTAVHRFRDGRIVRDRVYLNRAEALEAVGLADYAMSRENVELIRSLQPGPNTNLVTMLRDDAQAAASREALAPFFHEDFEASLIGQQGWTSRYAGLDGLRAGWLDWLEPWESYRSEVEDLIEVGDDVVVLVRDYGRRAGVTVEVSVVGASVWTVRDGKIAKAAFYLNRSDALEAVGLSERVERASDA